MRMKKISAVFGFIAFLLCYAIVSCQGGLSPLQIGGLAMVAFCIGAFDFPAIWKTMRGKKTWVNITYVAAKIIFLASTGLLAIISFVFCLMDF